MRKDVVWLFGALLFAAWGGNLWYFEAVKVEKPLFLEHYYEIPVDLLSHQRMYYIADRQSRREPIQIRVNEEFNLYVEQISTRSERGRLKLQEAVVRPSSEAHRGMNEPFRFREATVYYNDGTEDVVSLGEWIVHPNASFSNKVEFSYGKSSSDGTGSSGGTVREQVTIASVAYSFPDLLSDAIDVAANGNSVRGEGTFPMTLREGDALDVSYTFRLPDDDERRFHAYQLMIKLLDERGRIVNVQFINDQPRLYDEHLREYVRWREGGGAAR
ncbi:MAG TPA: hypothetical protein VEZ72_15750 [Paenibacillus sp.]|nr:hypothetical protein [Paenibacillus sp.]